ncbi:MAG TPA: protoheme IX farnesyltransferase [Pirellulaceae bacterium]|nr:protoheme IX farnesyltransferase [Pirellulaceae bacterium]HMO91362.1 protoheme IX farnesyltransferase [Pirellulaceae bacterium]HMP70246.1 protoheme IX farnesyltransferase [Pirellulaceae bacterium]
MTVPFDTVTAAPTHVRPRLADFVELTKPRISVMVLICVGISAFVSASMADPWLILHSLIGVFLVSASGCAANQFIERYTDWLMPRTANRPLPAQRISANAVGFFCAVTLGMGIAYLATLVNFQAAAWAGLTWAVYVLIYTPLKVVTSLNTYVGALAGAFPVLIGVAGQEPLIPTIGWAIFAILYIWQFPHFMAIAWKFRKDYANAGVIMFPVSDPTGRSTGWHALVFATLMIPVSLWAIVLVAGFSWPMIAATIFWGLTYLIPSWNFFRDRNEKTSRILLLSSLIHLPAMLLTILAAKLLA